MLYLRQSTASQEVLLGPFVDSTDGNTAETGLTIANTDIKLWVAGATTLANKNSGGATHISNGNYYAVLDATDTATVGSGAIVVQVAGALAVRHAFHILEEAVYDALFAASAPGYLQPTTAGRTLDVTSTGEAGLDYANINLPAGAIPALGIVDNGTAQSATSTTLVLRSAAAFADDALIGATILITGGTTGVGETALITDYVGSTDTATIAAWSGAVTPSGTITYVIFGTAAGSASATVNANVTQWNGTNVATPATAGYPAVTLKVGTGTGEVNLASGKAPATIAAGDIAASAITATSIASNAITAAKIAADAIGASQVASDAVTEIQTGLATSTALGTLQTTATGIKTKTDFLPSATAGAAGGVFIAGTNASTTVTGGLAASITGSITGNITGNLSGSVGSVTGLTAADVGSIKTKTDQLAFTKVNELDVNIKSLNDVTMIGNGQSGNKFSV